MTCSWNKSPVLSFTCTFKLTSCHIRNVLDTVRSMEGNSNMNVAWCHLHMFSACLSFSGGEIFDVTKYGMYLDLHLNEIIASCIQHGENSWPLSCYLFSCSFVWRLKWMGWASFVRVVPFGFILSGFPDERNCTALSALTTWNGCILYLRSKRNWNNEVGFP